MNVLLDARTAIWIFAGLIIAFSACMLFLQTHRIWSGIFYWLTANAITLFVTIVLLWTLDNPFPPRMVALPAALILLSNLLRGLSLIAPGRRLRTAAIAAGIIALYLLIVNLFDRMANTDLAVGGAALLGAILPGWHAYICHTSPRWNKLRGSKLFTLAGSLLSLYLIQVGLSNLGTPQARFLFQHNGFARTNLAIFLSYFIVIHICVIAMLVDRLSRRIVVSQMRQRRQGQLVRQAAQHAREMTEIAEQQRSLLDILIHEVRQPFNNAQAALQDVMMTLQGSAQDRAAGNRLQAILDHIVLTLSNAIVGASLLERKSASILVPTDIIGVCQLACSDIGYDWREQIDLSCDEETIFVQADPVLLRLALRNLLDNAVKHSAHGHKVMVEIRLDEARLAAVIRVRNWPAKAFKPDDILFERGMRGPHPSGEGKGLGLFIVREVALMHHGSVQLRITKKGWTEFELLLPV